MFNSLINPTYPKTAIGIEQNCISVVNLGKQGRRQFEIRQAASIELPDYLLRPSFAATNISNQNEFIVLLNEAVERAGLRRKKNWSVSLPANTARASILTLETQPASKKELDEVISWKAERNFGAPMNEMRLLQYPIANDASNKARYFAVAVKLSVLEEYEQIFAAMGWHVGLVLPRIVSEANWLMLKKQQGDSLLISSQKDGFTAILMRNSQPNVVRSVACSPNEKNDELFRLLMFYRDRLGENSAGNSLDDILIVGEDIERSKLAKIANEALETNPRILRPEEIGLTLPVGDIDFNDVAAPAGLASIAFA